MERICDGCKEAHAWNQPCRVIVPDHVPNICFEVTDDE